MPGRRILVVDDDRTMVSTLVDILALRGWDPIPAYDGAEAIELATKEDVDVVLMDVRMPKVDGVSALRTLKQRRPGIRVILMTAFAAQELLAQAAEQGAVEILPKPVDLQRLLPLLDEAARGNRSVLIVDGGEEFPETLSAMLDQRGIRTVRAESLTQALHEMTVSPPAAVMVHLALDHLEGWNGVVAIRELSQSVLLILYSGRPERLSHALGDAPPGLIDAAFTKPLPIDQLLELLDDGRGA